MYHLRIEIPGLPTLQSGSFGSKWSRREHDKTWKDLVGWSTAGKRPGEPLERVHVSCTRFSGSRRPDETNLRSSFKPLIDGLVNVGIMVDDDTKHMSEEYDWQPCPGGEGRVVIEVTEVGER